MVGVLRYEWRRITSIRSTWILLGLSILISGGFALLFVAGLTAAQSAAQQSDGGPGIETLDLTTAVSQASGNFILLVLLGTVAAQAFGQEYRHGTIRLTLTAFPRRIPVFAAKIVVCCLLISAAFAVSNALAWVILRPNTAIINSDIPISSFAGFMFRSWLYLMGFCLIVFAVTLLTRILALGVIIPLIFAVVLEGLLVSIVSTWIQWLPKVLPFSSGAGFVQGEEMLRNGLVFAAWVVILLGAGLVVFDRRDA